MPDEGTFTITAGTGEITFWKTPKGYMRQCIGIGKPTRCSKELYDSAKELYEKRRCGNE